jgi:hypothetical protein
MLRKSRAAPENAFASKVLKIGINPYVRVPAKVLAELFQAANRTRSPIPVRGKLNGADFRQTLVKYKGVWRLYLNTGMRQRAGLDVGDQATVSLAFDGRPPKTPMNAALSRALATSDVAEQAFAALVPSRKKEIVRYLNSMKTEASLARNIDNVLLHLTGKQPKGIHAVLRVKP